MVALYNIHLINHSASTEVFWCFLAQPQELANTPGVYANSSVCIAIDANALETNHFMIPVEYVVGAGASNIAVGLNVFVDSSDTQNADIGQTWEASYASSPPNMGPNLFLTGTPSPADTIGITTNAFDQMTNEANGWFSNQSFGIMTDAGFMGMSWSPSPNTRTTITPRLGFYITTGAFSANGLADWTSVSNDAALVQAPFDFSQNNCTVTLTASGAWKVSPGAPF